MAKILIVDDDSGMLQFLDRALTNAGHEIKAFESAHEALALLESGENFDLLLSDIIMPGIDGIELSQKAKALSPALKVMFMTGFTALSLGDKNPENTGNPTMAKPFHLNDLVDKVSQILPKKSDASKNP